MAAILGVVSGSALSAVALNSVPALTLLSGSTPPEKTPLSLCGGERYLPARAKLKYIRDIAICQQNMATKRVKGSNVKG